MTRIVIFAKAPVPGKVKTRLVPALGAVGAARLARRMLRDTVAAAIAADLGPPELCVSPEASHDDWKGNLPSGRLGVTAQAKGALGERLARAAEGVIAAGEAIVLIGTDCPDLDAERLRDAATALTTHDAVIHPTIDGGYALLGLNRFDASLFSGIAWSTSSVARETMERIAALGWSLHVGATLRDIDEPEDLRAAGMI